MRISLIALLAPVFSVCCTSGTRTETSEADSVVADIHAEAVEVEDYPGEELHDSDYGIFHFPMPIGKAGLEYAMVFHLPDKQYYIYDNPKEEGAPILTVPFSEDADYEMGQYAEYPESSFSTQDFNFDGNNDLSIVKVAGMSNVWSDIYLFDPSTKSFVKNDFLSEKTSLYADPKEKVLKYFDNGGMAGAWFTSGIIQWQQGSPVEVRSVEQTSEDSSSEVFIRTVRVPDADGKLVIACVVQIQQLDGDREGQCLLQGEWTEFDRYPNLIFASDQAHVVRTDGRSGPCEF